MTRIHASIAALLLAVAPAGCGSEDDGPALPRPVTLASGQHGPRAMAVDGDGVYWTNDDGTIVMLQHGQSTPRVLAKGQGRSLGIAVDRDSVFWTSFGTEGKSDGAVRKTTKLTKGDVIELMAGQAGPIGIALDDACVYWTSGGTQKADGIVMSMWKEGILPVAVSSTESAPVDVGRDLSGVYWIDRGLADGQGAGVKRVKQVGDAPIVLADDPAGPGGLTLDPDRVIWDGAGEVQEISKDGGSAKSIAAGEDGVTGLAADASNVYWAARGDGEVKRAPIGGGAAVTLAVGQQGAADVAVDAHAVYWLNAELGAVMMLAK